MAQSAAALAGAAKMADAFGVPGAGVAASLLKEVMAQCEQVERQHVSLSSLLALPATTLTYFWDRRIAAYYRMNAWYYTTPSQGIILTIRVYMICEARSTNYACECCIASPCHDLITFVDLSQVAQNRHGPNI